MGLRNGVLFVVALVLATASARAYEVSPFRTPPGVYLGVSAAPAPAGLYGFSYGNTYQGRYTGPVTGALNANPTIQAYSANQGFIYVPKETIFGGTYSALVVAPYGWLISASPLELQADGISNTFIQPLGLNWMFGDFALGVGFGVYLPNGKTSGPAGMSSVGVPYWTFQPLVSVSYLKNDWTLTATIYAELNTRNPISKYTTGNVLHAELTAAKTIGNWTIGPVGYYVSQVSNDTSSDYYSQLIQNGNRFDTWAVGGLLSYSFGTTSVYAWATQEFYTTVSGATSGGPLDMSATTSGLTVQVGLNYQLWAPGTSSPAPSLPKISYRK